MLGTGRDNLEEIPVSLILEKLIHISWLQDCRALGSETESVERRHSQDCDGKPGSQHHSDQPSEGGQGVVQLHHLQSLHMHWSG